MQRTLGDPLDHGFAALLTRSDHPTGTDRLAEVVEQRGWDDETIIVNVQGDEPLIPPSIIRQVAENLAQAEAPMATLAVPMSDEELFNPNAVKVVMDRQGYALYFSRAPIAWERDGFAQTPPVSRHAHARHLGIYAYRAGFIQRYVSWQASELEQIEALEQLRVLWYGERIHVAIAEETPPAGVDTPEDLARVRAWLAS